MARARSAGLIALVAFALCAIVAYRQLSDGSASFVGGRPSSLGTQRQLGVGLRAVDNALKDRIASVKKTSKITDAMRLVAAAKVRRAQDGFEKSQPFSEELTSMIKGLTKKLKGTGLEAECPLLKVPEKVNSVGILLIASNRGLCGGYNSFIGKRLAARVEQLNDIGIAPNIVTVGKKGLKQIVRRCEKTGMNYSQAEKFWGMPDRITSTISTEIADYVRNMFLSGEVDKVEVIYSKFYNLLKSEANLRTLLPLSPTGVEDPEDLTFKLTSKDGKLSVEKEKKKSAKAKEIEPDVIFDQPPEVLLNSMLPLYLTSQILTLLLESQACELGSRMSAMKAATDNANDLVDKLTMIYNKKRQAQITAEITEIAAGAMGVKRQQAGGVMDLGSEDTEESMVDEFLSEVDGGSVPDNPVWD